MSLRVSSYTVEVGGTLRIPIARGEDREYRFAFTDAGAPLDMSSTNAVTLKVSNPATGQVLFTRLYSGFQGAATAGTPRFRIYQADTVNEGEGVLDVDVMWEDGSGYETQLLAVSPFEILRRLGAATDPVTTPPAIPVTYGINWGTGLAPVMWTAQSGGYQLHDGVAAYDGSLGATAISTFLAREAGVTAYPIDASGLVATGWQYIGQHGGVGATGPAGAGGTANTLIANAPIAAQLAIKISSNLAGNRYEVLLASDPPAAMAGVSVATAPSGGATFAAQLIPGVSIPMRSDGVATLVPGCFVRPSPFVDGHVTLGAAGTSCGKATTPAGATLGAEVYVL